MLNHSTLKNTNKLIYSSQTQHGKKFFIFDAVTKAKKLAFDHQKLTRALAHLTEQEIKPENLPFNRFELISEKVISLTIDDKLYQGNIENYLCRQSAIAIKDSELVLPNGKLAVYIKAHNLWLRNLDDNSEKKLTTDGIKNFGYATNNAGWVRGDKPVVKWSPDSKKLTSFKHDS